MFSFIRRLFQGRRKTLMSKQHRYGDNNSVDTGQVNFMATNTVTNTATNTATNATESVLCFPTELLAGLGEFRDRGIWSGLRADAGAALDRILTSGRLQFVERGRAEVSEEFVQLIPYCMVFQGRQIFRYQRSGSEGRLTGLFSIGVGGHINPVDGLATTPLTYHHGVRRELLEEIGYDIGSSRQEVLGLIYDPSNAVGRVHVGVVHALTIPNLTTLTMNDPGLAQGDFWPVSELVFKVNGEPELYESWTRLVVKHVLT